MIFPVRTERRLRHTPWLNVAIIVINVVVFAITRDRVLLLGAEGLPEGLRAELESVYQYYLHPLHWRWYQFFTYQFLHADIWHLAGNMLFLYIFGNAVEDRLRPWGYGAFYLLGGIIAGLGHMLVAPNPVLGASGSVSAVTGAFLALFPKTHVTVLFWLIFPYFLEVHSMYLILFSLCKDLFFQLAGGGTVAYMAHISGSLFGFSTGMLLLATRLLPREPYDFLALVKHWHRRRQFQNLTREGYSFWRGSRGAQDAAAGALSEKEQQCSLLRAGVLEEVAAHRSAEALIAYEKLLAFDASQVLPREPLTDLANWAMGSGRHDLAETAYEGLLKTYARDIDVGEVRLILGLVYTRYRPDAGRAREHLQAARPLLTQPARIQLAEQLLSEWPSEESGS